MRNKKLIYSLLLIGFILVGVLALIIFSDSQKLKVNFLDVGQGDAILISQGNNQILIDGGPSGQTLLEKMGRNIPFWDRKIEMVVVTHPDQDHIQGLVSALKNYRVENILENSRESDSQVYQNLKNEIENKKINKIDAEAGTKIKFSNGAEMEIIYASKENTKDTNSKSIVSKLIFGENSFLLTGDIPDVEENKINEPEAKVLKISHHGSKNSTSEDFLEKVKAQKAIISVGKNNRYGHPAPELLERLQKFKLEIFRTDEKGDIQFVCQKPEEKCEIVAK